MKIFGTLLCLLSLVAQAQDYNISYDPIITDKYSKYQSISLQPYSKLDAYALSKGFIKDVIQDVAAYQINKYGNNIPTRNWLVGTFFSSFIAAYQATGDEYYLNEAIKWGDRSEWNINKVLDADDICPGQTYLDLYFIKNDEKMKAQLSKKLPSTYFNRTEIKPGELHDWVKEAHPFIGRKIWSWCDALYMAPPVFARMGKATGDTQYYETLHELYWDAVDFLYDSEEHLFFRNSKADLENLETPNGKKVFWGRGNGWVYGGLSRIINFLDDEDPMKEKYVQLFKGMSYSLAKYQMTDGLWRSSINDPEWFSTKETSGSSFFVFGMAKGINEGWLPKEYFLPIVLKGWSALVGCVTPEGKLGYGQIVAGSPHEVRPHDNVDYASGAFILAASELYKMDAVAEMKKIWETKFTPRMVAKDAVWSTLTNEPVIYNNEYIYFASYLKASGEAAFTAFCNEKWPNASPYARKQLYLNRGDEHLYTYAPAMLTISNFKMLALYGKKQCLVNNPRWGDMHTINHKEVESSQAETFQWLTTLNNENGKTYNFSFEPNKKPTISFTNDTAKTWSEQIAFLADNVNAIKFASNEKDRVDIVYTINHKVYHIFYKHGVFYNSKVKKIATITSVKNKPIAAVQGTEIYSSEKQNIWIQDVEYNENVPVCAFASKSDSTIAYKIAQLNKTKWQINNVLELNSNIQEQVNHKGGLTLMPNNDSVLVVSVKEHPLTGNALPNKKHQLFKGVKIDNAWSWEQLTYDPIYDHMRPSIVHGEENALFWITGDLQSSDNFSTDILMSHDF